jgi:hypothetical protein
MSFYDYFLYEKFKTLADGYRWTIEFLIGWKKFMGSFLEIRILNQISQHSQGKMALKFWLKARDVAIGLKGLGSSPFTPSTDEIHLQTSDVKAFTDALFTNSSMPTKVLIWLENENQFLASLNQTSLGDLPIKKLSYQLGPGFVSVSYLLEYILRDYLPGKKRYINMLCKPKPYLSNENFDKGSQVTKNSNDKDSLFNESQNSAQLQLTQEKINVDRENRDFYGGKKNGETLKCENLGILDKKEIRGKLRKAIKLMNTEMEDKRVGISRVLGLLRVVDPVNDNAIGRVSRLRDFFWGVLGTGLGKAERERLIENFGYKDFELLDKGTTLDSNLFSNFSTA